MKELNQVRRKPRVQTVNNLPSKTVQSDVFRSEIRHVLKKFRETGIVEHMRGVDLAFRDITEFEDFTDMMRQSAEARQVFSKLPAKVRLVFENDVARWLDAAHDPEKLEALRPQLEKLGVMEPKAPVASPAEGAGSSTPAP